MNYDDEQDYSVDVDSLFRGINMALSDCDCASYGAECLCGRKEVREELERVSESTLRYVIRVGLERAQLRIARSSKLRQNRLDKIVMPFGKYENKTFDEIPLSYLDETISIMPPTWIVSMAKEYVRRCMGALINASCKVKRVSRHSWCEIFKR